GLTLSLEVRDVLSGAEGGELAVSLRFRRVFDFEPNEIVTQVPALAEKLRVRQALTALRGPLGGEKHFRNKLSEVLTDPARRGKLLQELGLEESASGGDGSLMEEVLASTHMRPGD